MMNDFVFVPSRASLYGRSIKKVDKHYLSRIVCFITQAAVKSRGHSHLCVNEPLPPFLSSACVCVAYSYSLLWCVFMSS